VAVALIADLVRDPRTVLHLVPSLRRAVLLRDDLVGLAIVVHVGEHGELDVEAGVDVRFLPGRCGRTAGVFPPRDLLREPRDADKVGIPIAVHIDGEVAEVVVVVVREVQLAEPVFRPAG